MEAKKPQRTDADELPEPNMGELPDDFARLWFLIRRAAGLLDRAGEALFRQSVGISLAQFLVLSVVDAHPGPLKQQAIADRLGLTKGTVSKQIANAMAAGYLEVKPAAHSRREKTVSLTEQGTALVRHGDIHFDATRDLVMADIAPEDLTVTLATLRVLNAALDRG